MRRLKTKILVVSVIVAAILLVGCGSKSDLSTTGTFDTHMTTTAAVLGTTDTKEKHNNIDDVEGTATYVVATTGATKQADSNEQRSTTDNLADSATDTEQNFDRRTHGEVCHKAMNNKPQFLSLDGYTLHVFFLQHEVQSNGFTVPIISFITVYEKDDSAPYIGSYTRTYLKDLEDQNLIDDLVQQANFYDKQYENIKGINHSVLTDKHVYIDDLVFFSLPDITSDQLPALPDFIRNRNTDDYSLGSDYARLQQLIKNNGYIDISNQVNKKS